MLLPRDALDRSSLRRVVTDRIIAEWSAAGHDTADTLPPVPWPDDLAIGAGGIGADSLDLLRLAGSLNEMFHLHCSGLEDLLLARRTLGDWLNIILRSWALHPEAITFATSGSTGTPKPCRHDMVALLREAGEHAHRLQPRRILSAVPSHHIYGFLFTVLLPAIAGVDVVDIRSGLAPAGLPRAGDLLVSFPDHWRYLTQSWAQSWGSMPGITGVSSTSPLPEDLAQRLRADGHLRLVEIYGSSETGGIGWRDTTGSPFTLLDIWSSTTGLTPDGALQIADADGRTALTPDVVETLSPRTFRVLKRRDSAVQIGGINVFPARVAAVLEAHPAIAHAHVRLAQPIARSHAHLKALLVPSDPAADIASLRTTLQAWINRSLTPPERPHSLRFVPALPLGPLGKPVDWPEDIACL